MKLYPLAEKDITASAVIVANGNFPVHPAPLSFLKNKLPVVCCDGAVRKLLHAGGMPTVIVGDCDSLTEDEKQQYASIICKISEQDTNDLTKAVR